MCTSVSLKICCCPFTAEAMHIGSLIAAQGYFFPISDHVLCLKDDGTFYRFQVSDRHHKQRPQCPCDVDETPKYEMPLNVDVVQLMMCDQREIHPCSFCLRSLVPDRCKPCVSCVNEKPSEVNVIVPTVMKTPVGCRCLLVTFLRTVCVAALTQLKMKFYLKIFIKQIWVRA